MDAERDLSPLPPCCRPVAGEPVDWDHVLNVAIHPLPPVNHRIDPYREPMPESLRGVLTLDGRDDPGEVHDQPYPDMRAHCPLCGALPEVNWQWWEAAEMREHMRDAHSELSGDPGGDDSVGGVGT